VYAKAFNVNPCSAMNDIPPDYRVGYKMPPLHSRFRKGQSGNPEGGRRHRRQWRQPRRLAALLEAALDRKPHSPGAAAEGAGARRRAPATGREAIVARLVDKAAAGDLRATKMLLDMVLLAELTDPRPDPNEEDPREVLLREINRLAEAQARAAETRDESVCGD